MPVEWHFGSRHWRHRCLVCDRVPVHAWSAVLSACYEVLCALHRRDHLVCPCTRTELERLASGVLGWVLRWLVHRVVRYQLSLHALIVLDCTLRRVLCVLPVPKQPLVKRASTKVDEVLLSGYAVDNG